MTSRTTFDERLREAQELNAASKVRPASRAYRGLLKDVGPLDPAVHGPWVVEMRVRALIGQAACTHALTGDLEAARRLVEDALALSVAAGEESWEALAHGQEGLLLLRAGRARQAVASFDRALATVDTTNHRDQAVLRINRAAAQLECGDLGEVVSDHELALFHAREIGDDRYAAFALLNLGYARYQQGDFPAALSQLDEAARLQPGGPDGWSESTRAQVLLDAGLVTEAEQVLAECADLLAADDLTGELADTMLARARCALLLRRPEEAVRWARGARRVFARVGNDGWALQSELVALEARLELDRRAGPRLGR